MNNLLTFHGGPDKHYIQYGQLVNFREACTRLIRQAVGVGVFNRIIYFNDQHLQKDNLFWSQHAEFIRTHPKGYGYWLWKPYIIKEILSQLNEHEILLYCDAGCEIDIRDRGTIQRMLEQVKTDLIVASEVGAEWGYERMWCKKDLYHSLGISDDDPILKTPQRQATAICLIKCDQTVRLVDRWYQLACNYHLLDDTPSLIPNLPDFREHRHDQAIFSLLIKQANIFSQFPIQEAICLYRTKNGQSKIRDVPSHPK